MCSKLLRPFENTQVIVFDDIDRDEERKPHVNSINSIKSYHSFTYQDEKCRAKERITLTQYLIKAYTHVYV